MSATLEPTMLDAVVERATPEQRRYLLQRLLARVVADSGEQPLAIEPEEGGPAGLLLPIPADRIRARMSPDQDAELRQAVRNTTPDQLLTHEELLRRLGLAEAHRPSTQ